GSFVNSAPRGESNMQEDTQMQELIDKLATLPVEGGSRGGPYVGIAHNDVTRAVVAKGDKIVPLLIDKLNTTSNLNQAIYIVFCLRELHAKSAKPYIQQLQASISDRFKNTPRDLTLDMQIQFFLRDVDSW